MKFELDMTEFNEEDRNTWPQNGQNVHLLFLNKGLYGDTMEFAFGNVEWQWLEVEEDGCACGNAVIYDEKMEQEMKKAEDYKLCCFISYYDGPNEREVSGKCMWCSTDAFLGNAHKTLGLEFVPEDWK